MVVIAALLSFFPAFTAAQQHPTESQVEAAYLFNFGKFIRWQPDRLANLDSFQICIIGKDPFGEVLDSTVAGENIGGKRITVNRLLSMQEAASCSVLFIDSSLQNQLAAILASARRFSLLTVSGAPHFAERGGIIGLVTQQGKIRFEVNRSAADESHLILSSELLKVATRVIEKPVPEN